MHPGTGSLKRASPRSPLVWNYAPLPMAARHTVQGGGPSRFGVHREELSWLGSSVVHREGMHCSHVCHAHAIPTSQPSNALQFACSSSSTQRRNNCFCLTKTYAAKNTISNSPFASTIVPPTDVRTNRGNSLCWGIVLVLRAHPSSVAPEGYDATRVLSHSFPHAFSMQGRRKCM